jgi:hypothetical protein
MMDLWVYSHDAPCISLYVPRLDIFAAALCGPRRGEVDADVLRRVGRGKGE